MEQKLKLDIVTPYGPVLSEYVDEVSASGTEGDFGVFPGHVPFITTLKIGILTYRQGSQVSKVFVNSGFAEVNPQSVTILADSSEKAEDIDVQRAEAAKKRAEERLKDAEKYDVARATAALQRALIRLQVAGKASSH